MFAHILIPTDGSKLASEAVDKGIALAREAGARATFLMVVEPFHVLSVDAVQLESTRVDYENQAGVVVRKTLAEAKARAEAAGVTAEVIDGVDDQPYRAIVAAADTLGCDLIAMASHGRRGVAALMIGSQTMKVLAHSKVPVLVYR
jgi:nucleotide-binding universal stress UspA family protein